MNYSNHDCRVRTKLPIVAPVRKKRSAKKAPRSAARSRGRFASVGMAAAVLLTFAPIADAQFVLQPNEAIGKDTTVYQHTGGAIPSNLYAIGAGVAPHTFKSLLQFDLTAVPIPAGQITLATLELYCSAVSPIQTTPGDPATQIPGSGPGNVSLYQANGTWTETGVTWATFPSLEPLAVDTEFVGSAGQWYTFDVTSLVQSWHSGSVANNGFALVMDAQYGQVTFLDSKGLTGASSDPTLAPRLTVVPEPSTGILGLCGMLFCAARRRASKR